MGSLAVARTGRWAGIALSNLICLGEKAFKPLDPGLQASQRIAD